MTTEPQPIEEYRRALAALLGVDEVSEPPWMTQHIADRDWLSARVEERQQGYGGAWEQVFRMARQLET